MQPVQDLTIDTRSAARSTSSCSRTPIRRTRDLDPKLVDRCAAAAARRRRQRPAAAGPGGLPRHRPRHRGALRHHAGDRRQRALRRLRPAHRLDHLHPVEPVPRHPGGRSGAAESLDGLSSIYLPSSATRQRPGAAVGDRHRSSSAPARCRSAISASFRRRRSRSTCAGRLARRRGRRHRGGRARTSACRESIVTTFPGRGGGLPVSSLTNELLLILARRS
jgi:hypothetical protein